MPVPALSPIRSAPPTVSAAIAVAETIRRPRQTHADLARIADQNRHVIEDMWDMLAAANDLLAKSHSSRSHAIR